jgi:hypothetical protein
LNKDAQCEIGIKGEPHCYLPALSTIAADVDIGIVEHQDFLSFSNGAKRLTPVSQQKRASIEAF